MNPFVLYRYGRRQAPADGFQVFCQYTCIMGEMEKIPSFNEFANASLQDIYGDNLNSAYQREANEFSSLLLLNNGDATFKKVPLPSMVQTMPILDTATIDYNNDGFEDLIIVGNIYNTEVETPRLDNPYGLILVSNKKDGYNVIGPKESGFYLKGNAKSVETISLNDKNYIIVGVNDGDVEVYEY